MELLFFWINQNNTELFENTGINLSPLHDFIVRKENDSIILEENQKWKVPFNIFKNDIIENVTAIVGKNGSGKTTLMQYIIHMDGGLPHESNDIEGYHEYYQDKLSKAYCIMIYLTDQDKGITIFSNVPEFVNHTVYEVEQFDNDTFSNHILNGDSYRNILKVYLSNSNYLSVGNSFTSRDKVNYITLTQDGFATLADSFFNKQLGISHRFVINNSLLSQYKSAIFNVIKKSDAFQSISDVLYFNKLVSDKRFDAFIFKVFTKIKIRCNDAGECLPEAQGPFSVYKSKLKIIQQLLFENYHVYIALLYANLILEVAVDIEDAAIMDSISSENQLMDLETLINGLDNINGNKEYYLDGLKEISDLNELVSESMALKNLIPDTDMAYDRSWFFDYETKPDSYIKALKYVVKLFKKDRSFSLKYLTISSPQMSSGERAFLNMFSWLNLIPNFHHIAEGISQELKDTIFLLIDEADLYLHPEWQKNYILRFLEELKEYFSGKKVQVIISTHSPLCLSDIPRENTVFLSRDDSSGNVIVDNRLNHKQSFGRDLYTLIDDSFFLKNTTMGLFASKYIDRLIIEINQCGMADYSESKAHYKSIAEKIEYVGNPIIKKKLREMLYEHIGETSAKIEYLTRQKNIIERQLSALESE